MATVIIAIGLIALVLLLLVALTVEVQKAREKKWHEQRLMNMQHTTEQAKQQIKELHRQYRAELTKATKQQLREKRRGQ